MKRAFTLIEVTLAIGIMAAGVLAIVGLYSFGFRENRQSAEDVSGAAYADAVISRLTNALSSPDLKWRSFRNISEQYPPNGWGDYFDADGIVSSDPESLAQGVFGQVMGSLEFVSDRPDTSWPSGASGGLRAGLVVMHNPARPSFVTILFRSTKLWSTLLSEPLYYAEVRFQGVADE